MNVVLSIDRYMAVATPIKYRIMPSYVNQLAVGITFFGFIALMGFWAMVYYGMADMPITPAFTRMCTNAVLPPWYPKVQTTAISLVGLLSVVIYLKVFLAYRSMIRNVG